MTSDGPDITASFRDVEFRGGVGHVIRPDSADPVDDHHLLVRVAVPQDASGDYSLWLRPFDEGVPHPADQEVPMQMALSLAFPLVP